MIEKQYDYFINVGYATNDELADIHIRTGDKVIFEACPVSGNIRIYQYRTRIMVGLVTPAEFTSCIRH